MMLSRIILLKTSSDSDRLVLIQAFADHPDRLTITEDDNANYGMILRSPDQSEISGGVNFVLDKKPLRIGHIIDSVEAVLLRNNDDNIVVYGDYTLNQKNRNLSFSGKNIELTEREGEIIAMLMRSGHEGCPRDSMLNVIWQYRSDLETHTLETHIYRLRQKIEDTPNEPCRLITIDNGYRLV